MDQGSEVCAVAAFKQRGRQALQLGRVDEALAKRRFFDAADLEALATLDNLNELCGFHEAFEGTRVEPCGAAIHDLHAEFPAAQVLAVDVSNLVLASSRGLEVAAISTT